MGVNDRNIHELTDNSEAAMNKYKIIYSVSWVTDGDPQSILRAANGNGMLKGKYQHRYAFGHSTVILCVNNIPIMNLGQDATMVAAEVKKIMASQPGPYIGRAREAAQILGIEDGYKQHQAFTSKLLPGSIAFISNESLLHHFYTGRAKEKDTAGDRQRVDQLGTIYKHTHIDGKQGYYSKTMTDHWRYLLRDCPDTPPAAKMALQSAYNNETHNGPIKVNGTLEQMSVTSQIFILSPKHLLMLA
ncbi:MAG: hypothetical protein GY750_18095 [Lentisphaerae bacterium]|nr:hypothetical protein [Lentisphaerota bacterium]MCP4103310.1 hypothetical protein [Lentisphaerota bacterium]